MNFQDVVLALQNYWNRQGCLLAQPYDIEKGAATFNPATFLRSLGPEPFRAAFVEPCRRPADGRYGENPNRLQHYFQFQVVMKPSPEDFQDLYLGSLEALGLHPKDHDIRFVHDDWESPTLGAWGLGWEVWLDGMEITQFTYFQQVGGYDLTPVMGEITYGLERICTYLQNVDSVFDIRYNDRLTYGDLYHQNEVQFSRHNFEAADVTLQFDLFGRFEKECLKLCDQGLPVPAFDYCIKASHAFNLLDARGAISVNERQGYILRVRTLARTVAEGWMKNREALGFPLPGSRGAEEETREIDLPGGAAADSPPSDADRREPLLVELGVEEMPARVFPPLLRELPALLEKHLGPTRLDPEDMHIFVTPRRITLSVASIRRRQPDRDLEIKGPPAKVARDAGGNWTKAALAFASKNGIDPARLELRGGEGGQYVYARMHQTGRTARELLPEALARVFAEIGWYKTMRWGRGGQVPFVRPVRWLAALLGDEVLPMEFAGCRAGAASRGHRFLSPGPVAVSARREDYLEAMRAAHVLCDQERRKAEIRRLCRETARAAGLAWKEDEDLLEHVNALVEYPVPLLGRFRPELLEIPEEVLVSEMREHQKYFALAGKDGKLANAFIAVANMVCEDMALVRAGNEKVLHARFADAEFFLKEDKQVPLAQRRPLLDNITYLAALGGEGTMGKKVERLAALVRLLGRRLALDPETVEAAREIASLCKCDLTTHMVGEFPELQGIMGRHYALAEGYPARIADGIRDHYLPRHADDAMPGSPEAALAGMADRLDSLFTMFAKGKVPTGSADPFALRRACWSTVALIVHQGFSLDLYEFLSQAVDDIYAVILEPGETQGLTDKLLEFFLARAKRLFQEEPRSGLPGGFAADTVEAAVRGGKGWHDFSDLVRRLQALEELRGRPAFLSVAETFKRVSNILKEDITGKVDPDSLREPAETALWQALQSAGGEVGACMRDQDYAGALERIVALREPVNSLFEQVLVNDPDEGVKLNRHRLLKEVKDLVGRLADFSAFHIG